MGEETKLKDTGQVEGVEWTAVPQYEGLYEAHPSGRVRSVSRVMRDGRRLTGRILKPRYNTRGYLIVNLSVDGKAKTHTVHKLIARTFLPNPHGHPMINHLDEVRTNNGVTNLEWCDNQHNREWSNANYYELCDPHGNKHEVYNLAQFSRDRELDPGDMCRMSQGKLAKVKGWTLWME